MKIQFTKAVMMMLFASLLFSTQSNAQFHRFHHWGDSIPFRDSAHTWNDSGHVGWHHWGGYRPDSLHHALDSILHHRLDSLHHVLDSLRHHRDSLDLDSLGWNPDSLHKGWHHGRDSGFTWHDSGFHHPDSGFHHPDSGFHWPDSGFHHPDSGFHWPDSGFQWPDTGMTWPDSGFHWPDSGMGGHHGPHRLADPNTQGSAMVSIYPNPVLEYAVIHAENTSGNAVIRIYDLTGKLTIETTIQNGDNQLMRNGFKAGEYIYQISDGDSNLATGRLIFQ